MEMSLFSAPPQDNFYCNRLDLMFPTMLMSHVSSGTGVILCIEKALPNSGVSKKDVNYVNAHATSTPAGDIHEYEALLMHYFGQSKELKMNSTKSMTGHLLGALSCGSCCYCAGVSDRVGAPKSQS